MRHGLSYRKFSRPTAHRAAMMMNLAVSLIKSERIETTLPKAKDLRSFVEKLITIAKKYSRKDPVCGKRLLLSRLMGNQGVAGKLMSILAKRYENRNGGYTRIMKNGFRRGDCAPVAIIELVDKDKDIKVVSS
ncbi:50S ribosomal protein L17 [Candidatus Anaplasma sp. TIGMIC]|uniref:50S ribosomal protein L17 n=1 Tax=Candidatus Anaplasma sp. TIGMIC TaxID=3020713 RepID=UPI00232FCB92|nr:50S ribosomal protein L17 [Candidatus Anaplasma sp. TIGMIC]MDB1135236.1 50S ribosomal protein L17 [Candidatus Anaplasma sp. TIGMIC]